jgi:type III secretion protein J
VIPTKLKISLRLFVLLLSVCVLASCSQELHHGLTEEQANEMVVTLNKNGINATKVPEGGEEPSFMLTVPSNDASKAWQILRENNMPRPAERGFGEVFSKTSLIPTAVEEKALYLQAVTGELSKTIEAINGVIDARVHVVMPESDVLKEELQGPTIPKAAVLIKYKPDRNGGVPFKSEEVRQLVANSIEGLKPSDVVVVSTEVYADKVPDMIHMGPLKISKDSQRPVQFLGVLMFLVFLIFGMMFIFAARSSMKTRKELEALRASIAIAAPAPSQLPEVKR